MPSSSSQLVLALLAVAAVHGAAPTTNAVNKWSKTADANGVFTATGGQVEDCTADMDVFPDKAKVSFANFSVEYKNNYKIVTNKGTTPIVKYLLWQRGCPKPPDADNTDKYASSFEIPLRSVALTSATYFGAMEVMGERAALKLVDDWKLYSSSPCVHKQVADGSTVLSSSHSWDESLGYYTVSNGVKVANSKLNDLKIEATFVNCAWNSITELCVSNKNAPGVIQVADTRENTFYAAGEWIEYHALFFNREKPVMHVTDTALERWQCHSAASGDGKAETEKTETNVLFLNYWNQSYPDYATYKGWAIPGCHVCDDNADAELDMTVPTNPSWKCTTSSGLSYHAKPSATYRWCQLIKAAGGRVINEQIHSIKAFKDQSESATVGPWMGYQAGSKSGLTDAQLLGFAKYVDVLILMNGGCGVPQAADELSLETGESCHQWWTSAFEKLEEMKAVKEKNVWDTYRRRDPSGGVDYFSQIIVEPDVMLEDMIKAISNDASPSTKEHQFVFLRNTFSSGFGDKYSCKDKPSQVGCVPDVAHVMAQCTDHSAILPLINDGCSTGSSGSQTIGVIALIAAILLVVGMGCWFRKSALLSPYLRPVGEGLASVGEVCSNACSNVVKRVSGDKAASRLLPTPSRSDTEGVAAV